MKATLPARRSHRTRGCGVGMLTIAIGFLCPALACAADAQINPAQILQDLRGLNVLGTVLHVAAHPDDENTQLITYLARGRGYRTAYLSITRGDGGQNLLGPEFGEQLGIARTHELLAARQLDGGRQFFTRAIDFGYSKSPQETLRIWDRQQVLSDVVRIIRTFRPDVIVTRFSPQGGGHGHHTASAILAAEAFKLSGDPAAFPEQLDTLKPWRAKRILINVGGGRGGGGAANALRIDVGGNDPVSGEPFGAIASRSRAMHKTQGFGNFGGRGGGGGPSFQSFQHLDGEPAANDIMDGVDTTWSRIPSGNAIGQAISRIVDSFKPDDPAATLPSLLDLRKQMLALPDDPLVDEKREQLDGIIKACLGLAVETTIANAEVVPGEAMNLRHAVSIRSETPARWVAVRYPALKREHATNIDLRPAQIATYEETPTLPADTALSQPYWLRRKPEVGIFHVDDASLIGRPTNPPAFPVEYVLELSGQTIVIADEPVQIIGDPSDAAAKRSIDVIPPVSMRFVSDVRLFAPGASKPVEVEIAAHRAGVSGTVSLEAPRGWSIEPKAHSFSIASLGQPQRATFTVTAPAEHATAEITARAEVNGVGYANRRIELAYDHIPRQLLQPPATLKALSLDLAIRGNRIGYIPGAGDSVAECLQEMGYTVTQLTGADLKADRLKEFDAVVFGVRAFNTRTDLESGLPALFGYVESGGNVIVQYNRPNDIKTDRIAPYNLRIVNERITDEHAEVSFLAPDHPALNMPNKITKADFDGWVQERGIYFPNQWDEHFTPLLAFADPGEQPKHGGLLVARHGNGHFVYTGLAWFRQLPEGVPGAYRLFANLVSLKNE